MDFRIYGYDLNESYHMGQEVRINVTGLLVGGYGTQMQIGVWYTNPNTGSTSLGGMDKEEFIRRAQRQGLPAATDAEPYTVKISDLEAWKNDKEKLIQWQCQLVKIENVSFDGGGQEAWCNNPGQTGSTNRTLKDAEGNSITVRTSDKSKFASQILPKGTGSVVAILGYYNGTWQLTVMDPQSGCIDGFEFVDAPSGPSGDAIYSGLSENATSIDWTFEDNSAENVNEIWAWKSYNGLYYLNASAFVGNVAYPATAYACSPVIDLTAVTSAKMTFDQTAKFQTTLRTLCSVVVREEGASDWTELTVPAWPAAGSWDFVSAGEIDLSAYAGKKIQVGFKYGSSAEGADTWRVKNLKITE